ncbi:hypothetical protein NUW54_g4127 [Trametes sanguinea]|uniref:Uncharacterized protein n=1 Tax=Trametes sanguinea TaxID=158606 RepID=A0ACC1Q0X9_9APHY|nr:hypothetical protein NUW54_g4127 [Trametes sanguinea]
MNYGVVVVMDEGGGKGIVSSANAESTPDTSLARTESRRTFRLILSPYLFKVRGVASLVVNAILLGQSVHAQNLTGGGVAAVLAHIPEDDPSMAGNQTPLHCEFVTIGSATDGLPDVAESMHSRNYWAHVAGREIAYRKVRVT